jgi:ribokinase
MKKVIGFGALNVDNFFRVENLLLSENPAYPIDVQAGGSAANTITALAKLGIDTGFIGIVATDAYGKLLLSEFKGRKVDASHVIIRKSHDLMIGSGSLDAFVDRKGRRSLFVKPQVNNSLNLNEIDINYANTATYFHLSSFVDDAQLEIQKKIINKLIKGIKISFSPGSIYCEKGLESILPIIKKTDILFLDKREIYQLLKKNYKVGAQNLLKLGTKIIVVTKGKDGAFVTDGKENIEVRSRKVKVVDTTGAGDAFAAGFIYGQLLNLSLKQSAEIGNAVASFSIQKIGARMGLPNRKELSSIVSFLK